MQLRMLAAGAMVSAVMGLAEAGVRSSPTRHGFADCYGPSASFARSSFPTLMTCRPAGSRASALTRRSSRTWIQRVLGA